MKDGAGISMHSCCGGMKEKTTQGIASFFSPNERLLQ